MKRCDFHPFAFCSTLEILLRYHAERSHEIASACAKQCSLPDCLSLNILREIPSFVRFNMDSERPDEGKGRNISEVSKTVSNDVLTDWNADLCKEKETVASAQTRAAGNSRTQDPSSSQIREAGHTVKTTTGSAKRDVREKSPGKKSAPKHGSERQSMERM